MAKNLLERSPFEAVVFLFGLVFLFLLLRNSGLYPTVFADEYVYSKFARLIPLHEATVPSYVYLKLYSVTNACGGAFLGCAQIINSVSFVIAALFIYLIAREATNKALAVAVSLAAIVGPINSYTAYFMPESLFFLSFWVFAWYLLKLEPQAGKYYWLTAGVIYGLSALVKPHSLFLMPAILVYVFYFAFKDQMSGFIRQGLYNSGFLIIGAFSVKFMIGYMMAGSSGITIFGPAYGSIVTSSANPDRYLQLLTLSIESLKGHLLVLSLIYGLPLALTFLVILRQVAPVTISDHVDKVSVFALLAILNLVFVVALFTASVADAGPYESVARLHMRYYNFALPLLYIVAAGALASDKFSVGKVSRYAVSGLIGGIALYALCTKMTPYLPAYVDNPELRGLFANPFLFNTVGVLLILALFTWAVVGRLGLQIYLYGALPLAVLISSYYVTLEQRARLVPDLYDKAGIFTKQYLSPDDISKVLIVGSEGSGLFRSLYHLDNPSAALEAIPRGSVYDISKLAPGKEWVLVIGDQVLPETTYFQLPMNGFTLTRAAGSNKIDFRKASWPGVISRVRGLSQTEPWGTWSSGDLVSFEFFMPLPERFNVTLLANSFGPNSGKELIADVDGNSSRFILTGLGVEKVTLSFENQNRANTLSIRIPHPTSPKSLGLSGDDRNIGIGLVELTIESR